MNEIHVLADVVKALRPLKGHKAAVQRILSFVQAWLDDETPEFATEDNAVPVQAVPAREPRPYTRKTAPTTAAPGTSAAPGDPIVYGPQPAGAPSIPAVPGIVREQLMPLVEKILDKAGKPLKAGDILMRARIDHGIVADDMMRVPLAAAIGRSGDYANTPAGWWFKGRPQPTGEAA